MGTVHVAPAALAPAELGRPIGVPAELGQPIGVGRRWEDERMSTQTASPRLPGAATGVGPSTGPGLAAGTAADPVERVLAGLDPEQRAVAEALHGPVCVLAGAGTGKTRAITHRIAHGVLTGTYAPSQVLAVTFTTRAAGEMRGRLRALGAGGVAARTFHSAALRQARYFWPRVHGNDLPALVDSKLPLVAEAASRIRLGVDRTILRDLAAEIEWSKVSNVDPDSYAVAAARARRSVAGVDPATVARVISGYAIVCADRGRIDLEDVLLLTCALIADEPRVATAVRSQYRHLVVDEYQDVSPLQQRLLDLWLGDRAEVCVVGDPGQTIYSFAGASPRYLLDFGRRYPTATLVRLERNYRSTPEVLSVANRVLGQAADRSASGARVPRLVLRAQNHSGPEVGFTGFADGVAEATAVAKEIAALVSGPEAVPAREIAVLFRVNAMSAEFEQALDDAHVPYVLRGAERFFDREEVRRAVTLLRGTARAWAAGTLAEAVDAGESGLVDRVRDVLRSAGWSAEDPPGNGRARERWESLAALAGLAADTAATAPAATLTDFVAELDARIESAHAPVADGVTLSSLHSAKGLEWDVVFLAGVHEGGLPLSYAETPDEVEEERRLLYVGATRARRLLRVSWSATRTPGGRGRRTASRFLDGIRPADSAPDRDRRRSGGGSADRRRTTSGSCRVCGAPLATPAEVTLGRCAGCPSAYDEALFERLRSWRTDTARAQKVPAYVVLTDATLQVLAERRPASERELVAVPGIGAVKVTRYGEDLLRLCATVGAPDAG